MGTTAELDLEEMDLDSQPSLTTVAEPVTAEIAEIFPEPLPAPDPNQDFFSAAAADDDAKASGAEDHDRDSSTAKSDKQTAGKANKKGKVSERPDEDEQSSDTKALGGAGGGSKKKKKKRGKPLPKESGPASNNGGGPGGDAAAAAKRSELREKLRSRMAFQHELGPRGGMLNHMGRALGDIGEAVKEEASGKNVPQGKQEAMLGRATNVFSSVFKGMDSKQKNYLSRKTDEVSGMATNLMKKLLGGPGKTSGNQDKSNKNKKKKQGSAQTATAPAATAAASGSADQEEDPAEFDSSLDPRLDDLVRSVHEKKVKPTKKAQKPDKSTHSAAAAIGELPVRPRFKPSPASTDASASSASAAAAAAASANGSAPTKNQIKNKRKRQKVKDKLKLLKTTAPSSSQSGADPSLAKTSAAADSFSKPSNPDDQVPDLIPIS
jgi:translation initiation factor 5B